MTDRTASSSIRGYIFQFNLTIFEILASTDDTEVTVEGIEDFDIQSADNVTAVQVKYLESKHATPSSMRHSVELMLNDFCVREDPISYVLHVYFGSGNIPEEVDLEYLKKILTYSDKSEEKHYWEENNIPIDSIVGFIKKFKLVKGKKFDILTTEVIDKIKKDCRCDTVEAEIIYNNALAIVAIKASEKKICDRKITKTDFIKEITIKSVLYTPWFISFEGKEKYLKMLKAQLKKCYGFQGATNKIVFIDDSYSADQVSKFISDLEGVSYKNRRVKVGGFKPWVVVVDAQASKLAQIKANLLEENISFNDGREDIKFNLVLFNRDPVLNFMKSGIITDSSYSIKIISKEHYDANEASFNRPHCKFFVESESNHNHNPENNSYLIVTQDLNEALALLRS